MSISKTTGKSAPALAASVAMLLMSTAGAQALSVYFPTAAGTVIDSATRQYTVGGVTVTASAWSFQADGLARPGQYLGSWDYGLGVQNSSGDNSHTVDNQGWVDFVLFEFSQAVIVSQVALGSASYWGGDTDFDAFLGNDAPSLYEYSVADLMGSDDWNYLGSDFGGEYSRIANINGGELSANALIVAARIDAGNYANEAFKIKGLGWTTSDLPPNEVTVPDAGATLALLGLAMVGLRMIRR